MLFLHSLVHLFHPHRQEETVWLISKWAATVHLLYMTFKRLFNSKLREQICCKIFCLLEMRCQDQDLMPGTYSLFKIMWLFPQMYYSYNQELFSELDFCLYGQTTRCSLLIFRKILPMLCNMRQMVHEQTKQTPEQIERPRRQTADNASLHGGGKTD